LLKNTKELANKKNFLKADANQRTTTRGRDKTGKKAPVPHAQWYNHQQGAIRKI